MFEDEYEQLKLFEFDASLRDDMPCAWKDCSAPVELDDAQVMASSEGPVVVNFYRCADGHRWPVPQWEDDSGVSPEQA